MAEDEAPPVVRRSRTKTALIFAGVISAIVIAAFVIAIVVFSAANITTHNLQSAPLDVSISGSVTTKESNSHPTQILLVEQTSHQQLTADVSGTSYELVAPNGDLSWKVVVMWQGLGGHSGSCDGGFIQYSSVMSGFLTQDINC